MGIHSWVLPIIEIFIIFLSARKKKKITH